MSLGVKDPDDNGNIYFCGEPPYDGITFRNFPNLYLESLKNAVFKKCTFENCDEVAVYGCKMIGCHFKNVSGVNGHYTDFINCEFLQCCSQGPFLSIEGRGEVRDCCFDNITALGKNGDGYLIYSVYDKKSDVKLIKNCHFTGCSAENDEYLWSYCAYFAASKKRYELKRTDNWDEGEPIEIGSFDLDCKDDEKWPHRIGALLAKHKELILNAVIIFIALAATLSFCLPMVSTYLSDGEACTMVIRGYNLMEFSALGCVPLFAALLIPVIVFGCQGKATKETELLLLFVVTVVCYVHGVNTSREWLYSLDGSLISYHPAMLLYPVLFTAACVLGWTCNKVKCENSDE